MRNSIFIPVIAMGLGLTGCMGGGTGNRGLESVHQPIVRVSSYVFDADASSGQLTPSELRRVSDWLDAMEVGYGDRVSVDGNGSYGARAAQDGVADLLTRRGLQISANAPITPGTIAPGQVRIILTRSSARVPGCPDWSTRNSADFSATATSNYGCAVNANIAAMVADPTDLIRGQSAAGNDPSTASKAIETYRSAAPTGAGGLNTSGSSGGGR